MVSYHKSEEFGFLAKSKDLTFRKVNSKCHKLLGVYQFKYGLFDFYWLGNYLVFDMQVDNQVVSETEAHRLGFDTKEDYLSHNFNGFNEDNPAKQIRKDSILSLELVEGIFDELDNWIESVEEKQHKAFLKSLENGKSTSMRMMNGTIYEFVPANE